MALVYDGNNNNTEKEEKRNFTSKEGKSFEAEHGRVVSGLSENDVDQVLSEPIVKLIENYSQETQVSRKHYTPIHVDELTSRLAKVYEKIRKIIDWKDDNALRRGAIDRVLKRILFPNLAGLNLREIELEELAETLTIELIRGGHLPNDSVPLERLKDVAMVLEKYIVFLKYASKFESFAVKQKINYVNIILEIAACEIEEVLTNPVKEYGMINTMAVLLEERINFDPTDFLSKEEIMKFTYISTIKTLYDLDDKFITYILLKQRYRNWNTLGAKEAEEMAKELPNDLQDIEKDLKKPFLRKFTRIAEKVDTVFMLFDDILTKYKEEPSRLISVFEEEDKFESEVVEVYEKRYKTLKTRLFRLAVFSTLSVFLSNWVTFFIVEVPMARFFYEGFNMKAAIVDFLLPTAVMFFLVSIIRLPGKKNVKKVLSLAYSFVYKDVEKQNYQLRFDKGKPSMLKIIMTSIYFETIIFVFFAIAYVFYIAELPITSVVFDTFTISLTVFAAVAIKNKSRELSVDEDTSIGSFFLDMLSVPVAKVGSIFAKKWKEYNIIAMLFNFLIETPFAVILNIVQGWSDFISERKQEIH